MTNFLPIIIKCQIGILAGKSTYKIKDLKLKFKEDL